MSAFHLFDLEGPGAVAFADFLSV
ncbi:MAG: hypothetical protein ACKOPI_05660, partial [bacterium]